MASGEDFFALRRFLKGKIDKYELMDTIPIIDRVSVSEKDLSSSILYLKFKSFDKVGEILGLNEDDIWFYSVINNPYHRDYELYEYDYAEEDFFQGYGPWYNMNSENIELFDKISLLINGKSYKHDSGFKEYGEVAKSLEKIFGREISSIVTDWVTERNHEFLSVAEEKINRDINDALSQFGIELNGDYGFKITIANLWALYYQYDAFHLSISDLLKKALSSQDLGGWEEDRYEYQNDNYFDFTSFNREVERNLESILDKLDDERFDSKEYLQMVERIRKKYGLGEVIQLPKNKKFAFKIDGFEREGNKIVLSLIKPSREIIKIKLSEEGLNRLLYFPELFNLEDL